jgi:hypothetical protein
MMPTANAVFHGLGGVIDRIRIPIRIGGTEMRRSIRRMMASSTRPR